MIKLKENDFTDYKSAKIEIGMYLSFCLSEEEKQKLKDKWNECGGYKVIPWYEWVLQNVSVNID